MFNTIKILPILKYFIYFVSALNQTNKMINYYTLDVKRGAMHTIIEKKTGAEHKHATVDLEPSIFPIDDNLKKIIRKRLSDAAGRNSKSFELEVGSHGAGSFFDHVKDIKKLSDDEFFETSKKLAELLAQAQQSNSIPGGIFILLDCVYIPNVSVYVIIKAEPDDAISKKKVDGKTTIEVLNDIFLSNSQKLYKVGVIYERLDATKLHPNDKFTCYLFDEQFKDRLATYFHDKFLGFSTSNNAKLQIENFFNRATSFILNTPAVTDKSTLIDALRQELKNEEKTITPYQFAEKYIDNDDIKALYKQSVSNGLPSTIEKDTVLIKGKLNNKSMIFPSTVKISANVEDFDKNVTVIDNVRDFENLRYDSQEYTIVKIKGKPFNNA